MTEQQKFEAWQARASQDKSADWQPIETAPQDGTVFLGWRRGRVASCSRVPRSDCEAWTFGGESASVDCWPDIRPSHWMPLPPPPKGQE